MICAGRPSKLFNILNIKIRLNWKGSKNVQYVRMPRNNEKEHQEIKEE